MELATAIRRRRMVRNFSGAAVPPEARERLLRYALRAPSAGNSQGWAFLVLEAAEERQSFWSATCDPLQAPDGWRAGMQRAPLLVVALSCKRLYLERYAEADKGWAESDEARWAVPYWHVDVGMACMLVLLGALDEGLGACFFGVPAERVSSLRTTFGIPHDHDPVGVLAIGYPAPDTPSPSLRRGRRPAEEVVHRGRW